MTVNEALRRLADELSTDIPDLLTAPLTFGLVWLDLARLAGEEPPADVVAAALGEMVELVPVLEPAVLAPLADRLHA